MPTSNIRSALGHELRTRQINPTHTTHDIKSVCGPTTKGGSYDELYDVGRDVRLGSGLHAHCGGGAVAGANEGVGRASGEFLTCISL